LGNVGLVQERIKGWKDARQWPKAGIDLPHPEALVSTTDETLARGAEEKFDALVADHELPVPSYLSASFSSTNAYTHQVLHCEAYGSAYIKTHKISPDAWAQFVKQLAFF
jgi:carnitine O-acetyltransferase